MTKQKRPSDGKSKTGGKKQKNNSGRRPKAADAESTAPFPSREDIHAFIQEHPGDLNKREIARAFGIKGQDRTALRKLLREMAEEGMIEKNTGKSYQTPDSLPERGLIEITGIDGDGELRAKPVNWYGKGVEPIIYVLVDKKRGGNLKPGDRLLAKLQKTAKNAYEARPLKSMEEQAEKQIIGFFKTYRGNGLVTPTEKKNRDEYTIPTEYIGKAEDGDLVTIESLPPSNKFPRSKNPARVTAVLGKKDDPRLISLIAIHSHGIPTVFSKDVMAEAEALSEPDLSDGREDMRDIPLVTIDGADARDFDDAVFAEPDTDPKNEGGWHLIVAIADVSFYVRSGNALDIEAYKRGNSTYFADRVVPMLPERLSNDLCSLRPQVNRACLAVHMIIDKNARLITHRFTRGLMRSAARLTYEQVEEAHRGNPDDTTAPLMEAVIKPLYKAYSILKHARQKRGALELDLPERKAIINDKGQITAIVPRHRLDSHQLIEEFMILANVAAAEALERKNAPCIYRIHEQPSLERLEAARIFLKDMGYSLIKSDEIHPRNINQLLRLSSERGDADLVHTMLLRTQSQAIYHADNIGHFGLALEKYAHFTSPIRRYADLVVHRSLVKAYNLGKGGLTPHEQEKIDDISEHISQTERRSMIAERDVMDRFTAQYLSEHIGDIFKGKISTVTSFGMFVTLEESGADGILPMRNLPRDYYVFSEERHTLTGKNSGRVYRTADAVIVRLIEADPQRGSTVFEMVDGGAEENRRPRDNDRRHKGDGDRSRNGRQDEKRGKRKPGRNGKTKPPKDAQSPQSKNKKRR